MKVGHIEAYLRPELFEVLSFDPSILSHNPEFPTPPAAQSGGVYGLSELSSPSDQPHNIRFTAALGLN